MENATRHAIERMRQRGISEEVLDCLLAWGTEIHDHRGATVLYFDKAAKRRLERSTGVWQYKRIESKLSAYAVVNEDGAVITVGHRVKRINRN